MKRIFFQTSESCRNLTQDEIGFILDVLWEQVKDLKIALVWGEAAWAIRLETQRYIDGISNIEGTSVSFPLVTPRVTLLSLEDWNQIPEPRNTFTSLLSYRRFLIVREYHRAFRISSRVFMSSTEFSVNNHLIRGAGNSEWLVKGYKSSERTRWEYCPSQPTVLLPPPSHLSRGM
jgi:hypothetical protein